MAATSAETAGPPGDAPRRFLISTAVTDVHRHPELALPELADDVRRIDDLFLGTLGYRPGADPGIDPTRAGLLAALRTFARAPERTPDDYVVLYIATHGVTSQDSGRHYLLLADSDADDLRGTALPTDDLIAQLWEETVFERLLVMIDACYAEEGTDKALSSALEARRGRRTSTSSTGLVLVASSRRKEESSAGALSAAFDRSVRRRATAGHAPAHISLNDVMNAVAADPEVPATQVPVWSFSHGRAAIPAFLPNPRHIPDAAGLKLDEIDRIVALRSRERAAREQELLSFFLPRARGTDVSHDEVWNFTGRHTALADLASWLTPQRAAERLCVVTGDPGSGKSSLLGMVAVLTDPDRRDSVERGELPAAAVPERGAVDVAVNASHKSTRQLLDAIAAAAGCAAGSLGALAAELQLRSAPLVVLVDSVDEALAPHETVEELLIPLADPERQLPLRLLVGARPHIARRLPGTARRVDLDDARYADPEAVRAYTRKLLTVPGSALATADDRLVDAIAQAVAEAAGRSFLVARITARTIAREPHPPDPDDRRWRDELPRLPGEAMERDLVQRLGANAGQARDLLLPLAYAQGAGLPWAGIWPRLAAAITGRDYRDEHIVWLRQAAGSYVVESVEGGGSVYRVYHRALIEYLREHQDAVRVQRKVTEALRGLDHPYVRRYLALHAGEGGVLDPLVQDARFVLDSDGGQLLAAIPRLRTAAGRRAGRAVRDVEQLLRHRLVTDTDSGVRARLRLAAVCRRADALAASCDEGGELPWRARWAAWNPHEGSRRYEGMGYGAAYGVVASDTERHQAWFFQRRPWREATQSWDLDTGEHWEATSVDNTLFSHTWAGPPQQPGHAAVLSHDEYPELDALGRPFTVRRDRLLHLWDVPSGGCSTWRLPPEPGFDAEDAYGRLVLTAAEQVVVLAGADRPMAERGWAALRFADGTVLVYALANVTAQVPLTRKQLRSVSSYDLRLRQSRDERLAATCLNVFGTRAPRTSGLNLRYVTSCAAPRGLPPGTLLLGHVDGTAALQSVRSSAFDVVETGHDGAVTHLDLVTEHPQGQLLVTAGVDDTVRLTSLGDGLRVRTLLKGAGPIASLAVRKAGRQWLAAVATSRGELHRIDVDSGRPVGLPLRTDAGTSVRVAAFALGAVDCVSVLGDRRGLQLYDLVTGERVGGQVRPHEAAAVCAVAGTAVVGGSDGVVRLWPTAHAADSTQFTAHHGPVLAVGEVRGAGGGAVLVSVGKDHEIHCWDPADSKELWRLDVPWPGPWDMSLIECAAVGRTADGRDLVVTGESGGRVRVLALRAGLPVAEREFTVPGVPARLTTGRVGARDVVVVGTDTGRVLCWDVTHDRWYAQGPAPAGPAWTSALALAPDGSGSLLVGADDGRVREWSLPSCRAAGEPVRAHRGRVSAVAFAPSPAGPRPVSAGDDHRLVVLPGRAASGALWERRMPVPVTSFGAAGDALLCGDDLGHLWRLAATAQGWDLTEAVDAVRPVSAVTTVTVNGRTDVVAGSPDGSLQVRDGGDGLLTQRLRPVCESGVRELVAARWPVPDGAPRPLLFARSELGVLEYWDFARGDGRVVRRAGAPLRTPVEHSAHGPAWLAALPPDGDGVQSLLSLAVWSGPDASRLAVHDVRDGPRLDVPCFDPGREPSFSDLRALRFGDRLLVALPTVHDGLYLVDATTGRRLHLPDRAAWGTFALSAGGRHELLVVGREQTRILPMEEPLAALARPVDRRTRLEGARRAKAVAPSLAASHEHAPALLDIKLVALFPGAGEYAVAARGALAVVGVRDGKARSRLVLPSVCTALAVGPGGELAVGTRNGLVLFDRPWAPAAPAPDVRR
ncbi:caspase family protein [Streptomyces sp. NPDC058308]|uniref:caspase family protein n=1 Tax=Streptomyces sp. NPDC058308 TaxID=3346440 RepID=UPI0036E072C2